MLFELYRDAETGEERGYAVFGPGQSFDSDGPWAEAFCWGHIIAGYAEITDEIMYNIREINV